MCPSDTYKVYKQGSNVRIDTTLLGFDQNSWQRGSKSYLFKSESRSIIHLFEHQQHILIFHCMPKAPQLLWGKRSYIYKLQSGIVLLHILAYS